ncbi:hypothetical protein LINPERHAP1_LOCUS30445 [Linum perenne]
MRSGQCRSLRLWSAICLVFGRTIALFLFIARRIWFPTEVFAPFGLVLLGWNMTHFRRLYRTPGAIMFRRQPPSPHYRVSFGVGIRISLATFFRERSSLCFTLGISRV